MLVVCKHWLLNSCINLLWSKDAKYENCLTIIIDLEVNCVYLVCNYFC